MSDSKTAEESKVDQDAAEVAALIDSVSKAEIADQLGGEITPIESDSDKVASAGPLEQADGQSDEQAAEEAVEEAVEEALIAGYTPEEVKQAFATIKKLQTGLDTTNGRYGQELQVLKKSIADLKSLQQSGFGPMTVEDFVDTGGEYPQLVEHLAKDHARKYAALQNNVTQPEPEPEPTRIDPDVLAMRSQVNQLERNELLRAEKRLSETHPDWKEVAAFSQEVRPSARGDVTQIRWANPIFGAWVQSQAQDVQDQIFDGSDADYLTGKIAEFKQTLNTDIKPTPKDKLKNALLPKGNKTPNQHALTEEEIIANAALAEQKRNMVG